MREVSWRFKEAVSGHAEEDKRGKETGDKRGMVRKEEPKRAIGVTTGARREEVEMKGKKVRWGGDESRGLESGTRTGGDES